MTDVSKNLVNEPGLSQILSAPIPAPAIQRQLDEWLAPKANLPTEDQLTALLRSWQLIRDNHPKHYWPVIEDRFLSVRIQLNQI